jgi:hypothetical protein
MAVVQRACAKRMELLMLSSHAIRARSARLEHGVEARAA